MKYSTKKQMKIMRLPIIITTLLFTFSCNTRKESNSDETGNSIDLTASRMNNITQVIGLGKIEPENQILSLASASGGIITEILKSNGDRVKAGEAIIILDSETERNNLELAGNRIRTQENQVELDRQSIREAELRLENKKRLLESSRKLLSSGAETSQNLDDLETEVRILDTGLLKARTAFAISESKLSELRTEFRKAQIELDRKNLTAPSDGTVLNIMVTKGSSISQFSEFCEFAPDGKVIARCEIDEMFADRIREGQNAEITLVGRSNVLTTGKVLRTSPYLKKKSLFSELPGDREDRRVREVWIMLNDGAGLLFNMQVECKITL